MARSTTLLALGLAAIPYALLCLQGERKLTPTQAQNAAKSMVLLKAHCASCHGGSHPSAKLDLTTAAGIAKGGQSGKLFEPGRSKDSLLIKRLRGSDGMERMPLNFVPLSEGEIQMIAGWIDAGGQTDVNAPHWAYQKVVQPKVPDVKQKAWTKNPIDAFVLARLENEGLKPSPEASKETLIRRASLDITGLPPTPGEVDRFLADKRPDAYERLVDNLLASPHYGERQARIWLDLARYADSDGYEKDLKRIAWKWRDWVINAYNKNLPFDQFTIEQLAGDELPNPTIDDLVATGFHRNTMQNLEGGVDQAEAHFQVVLDRVNTTGEVWLGSTIQCARCHDHKYDPFTQKDYYSLAAFFSNSVIRPVGSNAIGEEKWLESIIEVPTPQQVAERMKLKMRVAELQRRTSTWTPELRTAFSSWKSNAADASWSTVIPREARAAASELKIAPDGTVTAFGKTPPKDTYTLSIPIDGPINGIRIQSLADPALPNGGPGRPGNGNYVITNIKASVDGKPVKLGRAAADYEQPGYPAGDALLGNERKGWAIDGQTGQSHELIIDFTQGASGKTLSLTIEQQSTYLEHVLGKFRVQVTSSEHPTRSLVPAEIKALVARKDRNQMEDRRLEDYYLSIAPSLDRDRSALREAQTNLRNLQAQIPSAMVMRDKPHQGPLTAYVRTRGEFLSKAELVTAGTPAFLPPIEPKPAPNRLDLAKWLVSKDNPLTARVQVNRMWEQVFGRGIVETSENFGTQGSDPTHPDLLDWLAAEFMRSGWDVKHMFKLILTSATYRQTSKATPALIAKDPQNLLYARGPRFRLEAEMIRDTVLKASGLLNEKLGGPSVYPYQPPGVWDSPYSGEQWMDSKDGDQFRRGLYTFWKRTMPYPSFMAFDATSREECTVRRIRTNTPLQALALMNDEATFVAAKALGKKMEALKGTYGTFAGPYPTDRDYAAHQAIRYGFRCCTARYPKASELKRLDQLLAKLENRYKADAADAKKVAGTPEDAAWTMVASVMLNLDETITKG